MPSLVFGLMHIQSIQQEELCVVSVHSVRFLDILAVKVQQSSTNYLQTNDSQRYL